MYLLDYIDLNQEQRNYLRQYFEEQVFPVLTPLAVDPGHPFPYISNLSLNLAVAIEDPETQAECFARVKVPPVLPRFVLIPPELQFPKNGTAVHWMGVPLEQAIAHNLEALFPGMAVREYHPFRITRNSDLRWQEEEAEDLLSALEQEVRKQRFSGQVVRMEIQDTMPASVRQMLMAQMDLEESDTYAVDGLLSLGDLMGLMSLPLPELKDPPWRSHPHPRLRFLENWESEEVLRSPEGRDIFAEIRDRGDILLHHPYQSFAATVQQFVTQAARDPNVLAIKMTLYRTSGDSPIVRALIAAAENGKQVAVLVELKARFDEENNIHWAKRILEQSGVHVVYGLVGLKTHTKACPGRAPERNGTIACGPTSTSAPATTTPKPPISIPISAFSPVAKTSPSTSPIYSTS